MSMESITSTIQSFVVYEYPALYRQGTLERVKDRTAPIRQYTLLVRTKRGTWSTSPTPSTRYLGIYIGGEIPGEKLAAGDLQVPILVHGAQVDEGRLLFDDGRGGVANPAWLDTPSETDGLCLRDLLTLQTLIPVPVI